MTGTIRPYEGLDGGTVLPYREYFRNRWPTPDTFVAIDIDLAMRRYNTEAKRQAFCFIEFKYGKASLTGGQRYTLSLIDRLMRAGDPTGAEYRGTLVINYTDNPFTFVRVSAMTGIPLLGTPTYDEFDEWLMDFLDPMKDSSRPLNDPSLDF